jgi:hypothetical protein
LREDPDHLYRDRILSGIDANMDMLFQRPGTNLLAHGRAIDLIIHSTMDRELFLGKPFIPRIVLVGSWHGLSSGKKEETVLELQYSRESRKRPLVEKNFLPDQNFPDPLVRDPYPR